MKGYTTINCDVRYADYADIGCGQAAMAALGIPTNLAEIGVGRTLQFTGSVAMAIGSIVNLTGGAVRKDGEKRYKENKKKVDTYLYMRK